LLQADGKGGKSAGSTGKRKKRPKKKGKVEELTIFCGEEEKRRTPSMPARPSRKGKHLEKGETGSISLMEKGGGRKKKERLPTRHVGCRGGGAEGGEGNERKRTAFLLALKKKEGGERSRTANTGPDITRGGEKWTPERRIPTPPSYAGWGKKKKKKKRGNRPTDNGLSGFSRESREKGRKIGPSGGGGTSGGGGGSADALIRPAAGEGKGGKKKKKKGSNRPCSPLSQQEKKTQDYGRKDRRP